MDEDICPSRHCKEVLDPLVEHGLRFVNVQRQRGSDFFSARVTATDKGLKHRDDDLSRRIRGLLGQQGAKLHHQDDLFSLFQPGDELVLVRRADDPADVPGGKLGESDPERACHLAVVIRSGVEYFLKAIGNLPRFRRVEVVDLVLEFHKIAVADLVFHVQQAERAPVSSSCQFKECLDEDDTDFVGNIGIKRLFAHGNTCRDMADQFFRHVIR